MACTNKQFFPHEYRRAESQALLDSQGATYQPQVRATREMWGFIHTRDRT